MSKVIAKAIPKSFKEKAIWFLIPSYLILQVYVIILFIA